MWTCLQQPDSVFCCSISFLSVIHVTSDSEQWGLCVDQTPRHMNRKAIFMDLHFLPHTWVKIALSKICHNLGRLFSQIKDQEKAVISACLFFCFSFDVFSLPSQSFIRVMTSPWWEIFQSLTVPCLRTAMGRQSGNRTNQRPIFQLYSCTPYKTAPLWRLAIPWSRGSGDPPTLC